MAPQEDRLDRVERILAEVAEQQAEITQQQAGIVQQQAEITQQQAGIVQQQAEITQQQASIVQQQAEITQQQASIVQQQAGIAQWKAVAEKLIESNARAIAANSEATADARREQALLRSELQEFIAIVREYVEVTNRRLNALEDRQ